MTGSHRSHAACAPGAPKFALACALAPKIGLLPRAPNELCGPDSSEKSFCPAFAVLGSVLATCRETPESCMDAGGPWTVTATLRPAGAEILRSGHLRVLLLPGLAPFFLRARRTAAWSILRAVAFMILADLPPKPLAEDLPPLLWTDGCAPHFKTEHFEPHWSGSGRFHWRLGG